MGLDGIAISGRGALEQALKIEALVQSIANAGNGQRVGEQYGVKYGQRVGSEQLEAVNGQLVGLGQYGKENGQRVGMEYESVARAAWRADVLDGTRISPVLDTADMLQALRALEANLQALRIQDATLERTVNELARPAK